MELFSELPTGPGRRIPPLLQAGSCLGGGVSATNSFEIPWLSLSPQCRPQMPSPDPLAVASPHLLLQPHGPCILPSPPAEQQPPGPPGLAPGGLSWKLPGGRGLAPLLPWPNPARCCRRRQPAQCRQRGQGASGANPNPSTSSPGERYGPERRSTTSNFLIRGSFQPTIIHRLICAHLLQREQYVLMGSLPCLELTLYKANK